jgi:hypothetical protein
MSARDSQNVLKSTKQRFNKKRIFGFDIETYNRNKCFGLASIVGEGYCKVFYSKQDFIKEVKTNKIFRNAIIFATNLGFDFWGTFYKNEDKNFRTLMKNGGLMQSKTYFDGDNFTPHCKKKTKSLKSLTFWDTLNYAQASVEELGDIIGVKKMDKPKCFERKPQTPEEWKELEAYNINDSTITYLFMKNFISDIEEIGCTLKMTIASTTMSGFRNKFLDDEYIRHNTSSLLEQFNAFYGGRTETFKRGYFKDVNYYDVNSLYPKQMRDKVFPDPNSKRETKANNINAIKNYEGISHIKIYMPPAKVGVLPQKTGENLIFPANCNLEGWWCHPEIRRAIVEGGIIIKVYKSIYFTKNCRPFKDFIETIYNKRLQYQAIGSQKEKSMKMLMNALFGKFGQKFVDRPNTISEKYFTLQGKEYNQLHLSEDGKWYSYTETVEPSAFCIPVWASYTTCYGRLQLFDLLKHHDPIYCDTDSIMTKDTLPTSTELGELKLESPIRELITVKAKFYAYVDEKGDGYVKIKGISLPMLVLKSEMFSTIKKKGRDKKMLNIKGFMSILNNPKVNFTRFAKFKECLRMFGIVPNEVIETCKILSLNDTKRDWGTQTYQQLLPDLQSFQESRPWDLEDYNEIHSKEGRQNLNRIRGDRLQTGNKKSLIRVEATAKHKT